MAIFNFVLNNKIKIIFCNFFTKILKYEVFEYLVPMSLIKQKKNRMP